jgi:hypothetical protein
MNQEIKNVVLISASPKIQEESVSKMLLSLAEGQMDTASIRTTKVDVRQSITKGKTQADFEAMSKADALVFAFPLYFFCLPGILIRFLQDYAQFLTQQEILVNNAKVYTIVNCGFPEPEINEEAVRVIQSFSRHTGASFRFGVLIGGGGMLLSAKDAPFMKKTMADLNAAFHSIGNDIQSEEQPSTQNISVSVKFPRKLYFFMGNKGWTSSARENGLKKKDLYRKPYRPE